MIAAAASQSSKSVKDQVGDFIIGHVSNTTPGHHIWNKADYPILQSIYNYSGIDLSISKHVFMLWLVALIVGVVVIIPVRAFLNRGDQVPKGWMNALEAIVQFIRDSIVKPNVGDKWVMTWSPIILTFFFFILFANGIGMIPIFDLLGSTNRFLLEPNLSNAYAQDNFINHLLHGGATATGNFNVTSLS